MPSLSVHFTGGKELVAKLHPSLIKKPGAQLVKRAAEYAQKEAANVAGTHDVGAVAHSLHVEGHGLEMKVRSSLEGATAINFGRRAGAGIPPTAELAEWAGRHGLSDALFPIARAIAQRGIKGRFFIQKAVDRLRSSELPRLIALAHEEIRAKWER